MIGQTLRSYRVLDKLGEGGMGEVYRATDLSLEREVAIKVLPEEVATDADRVARFAREARLLASLNHPSIAHLWGLETVTRADGSDVYLLVMELVEGEDLAHRLTRGPVPIDDAIAIARQIADALEEAHEKGIVHRDLKPGNIKVTPDGKVKVLDFGLAKVWSQDRESAASSPHAMTVAHAATAEGIILGTPAYMSPEQARGKSVDRRTDIWAFGVVLYEMLAGKRLFDGETMTDVLAAVLHQPIRCDALPSDTPANVTRLLTRCLERDAQQRLRDIGEARIALARPAEPPDTDSTQLQSAVRSEHRRRMQERWRWVALLLVATAAFATFARLRLRTATVTTSAAAHFLVETPTEISLPDLDSPAVSPDGRYLVFTGQSSSGTALWLRPLDSPDTRMMPGTEGAGSPFWSPDSASLAFVAGGEIKRLALADRTVQRICLLPRDRFTGGTWNEAGTIVFSNGGPSATLYQVAATGGDATALTTLDRSKAEAAHWWPQFLPGGRDLLFQVGSGQEASAGLFTMRLDSPGTKRRVIPDGARFQYAAGQLFGVQHGVLGAQPFDAQNLVVTGKVVPIASSVATFTNYSDWGWFSASAGGGLTWVSAPDTTVHLEWVHRSGKRLGTIGEPGKYSQIALSPDDKRLAVELPDATGRFDIWVIDVLRGLASRLTSDPANDRDPVWSPASDALVYSSDATGDQNLLRKSLLDSRPPAPLPSGSGATPSEPDVAESWSRDGNTLFFVTLGQERTVWTLNMSGDGRAESLIKGPFLVDEPHVSPDGRSFAYVSTESGRSEIYVAPVRQSGERVRVSTDGGGQPRWRRDGQEIFYLSLDGGLMSASVDHGAALTIGNPNLLISHDKLRAIVQGPDYDDYDVSSDGQRFLIKTAPARVERQRIHVVVNWMSLLK
jgi:serine/threonine protein kinase